MEISMNNFTDWISRVAGLLTLWLGYEMLMNDQLLWAIVCLVFSSLNFLISFEKIRNFPGN